eukprot:GFUD01090720.1.p1 GENE.GFUD01090720.1~~GFUD01090720.1.p1  ORF type:complete len:317 (+),score=68.94 GFUD01090720.1:82-1032(+)
MNNKLLALLALLPYVLVIADNLTKTDKVPVMEALDNEPGHVLVDYAGCFDIPDFNLVKTVSVHVGGANVGIKTREDISIITKQNREKRVYQNLDENPKIKAKLDACKPHTFFVRITYNEQDSLGSLGSLSNAYAPESFKALINSKICMTNDSLFLPLDDMKNSNPKFSACHKQLLIKHGKSEVELQNGLNSLEDVKSTTFEIIIQQQVKKFTLSVDMEVFKQTACPGEKHMDTAILALIVVSSAFAVVVLAGCVVCCVCRNKKEKVVENEIIDMNPEYGADYQDDKESELKDTNDYYFYAQEGDNIEVTDTNEYYD